MDIVTIMTAPSPNQEFLRCCMLYDFLSSLSAAESHRRLCSAFGEDIVSQRTCREWFQRFKAGDHNTKDKPRSGRPSSINEDCLRNLVESNSRTTTRELAIEMDCDQSTVVRHLAAIGKVPKLGAWVPHHLTQRDRDRRVEACMTFATFHQDRTEWLDSIITG